MSAHALRGAFDRIGRRLMAAIARGNKTAGDDTGNVQILQVRLGANEVRDDLPRLAEFGFTSLPPDGAHVVVLFVGGDRSNGVVIASGDIATRMRNLQPGESALYDAAGKHVYLKTDSIEIDAKGQPVNVINASTVTVQASGNVTVNSQANVSINASGSVAISGTAGVSITTQGSATCTIHGSLSATASGPVSLSAPNIALN